MVDNIAGVILAGGKSSRMGEDKALLPFGEERTLSEYQYKRLKKIFTHVYISSKEDKFDFTKELILEEAQDFAPTFGLLKIIKTLGKPFFALGVDVAFFSETSIKILVESFDKELDGVVASFQGRYEPLCGIYAPSIQPFIENSINKNCHRLSKILEEANIRIVEINSRDEFINMNTPLEYKSARELLGDF